MNHSKLNIPETDLEQKYFYVETTGSSLLKILTDKVLSCDYL